MDVDLPKLRLPWETVYAKEDRNTLSLLMSLAPEDTVLEDGLTVPTLRPSESELQTHLDKLQLGVAQLPHLEAGHLATTRLDKLHLGVAQLPHMAAGHPATSHLAEPHLAAGHLAKSHMVMQARKTDTQGMDLIGFQGDLVGAHYEKRAFKKKLKPMPFTADLLTPPFCMQCYCSLVRAGFLDKRCGFCGTLH